MNLKIGIIGTNFISDDFCDAALQVEDVELFAVYSRSEDTGYNFAEKHHIPHVFTNYEEFLSSDIDAVYIASPNFAHCQQAIQAMTFKKHVLCEKVMATNEEEVLKMIKCSQENQVILLEAMRPDFDPALKAVEESLPQLGKLRRATFEFCQYSSRYDHYRNGIIENAFNPALGNAAVMDIGVYCIHSLIRFFGMPNKVHAMSTKLKNGFDGSGIVLMEYENMIAEAIYSKISVSTNPSVIQGEDGSIQIDYISKPESIILQTRTGSRDTLKGGKSNNLLFDYRKNNMVFEIIEFTNLIKSNSVNHKYLSYSLDTIRIIDEVRKQCNITFK